MHITELKMKGKKFRDIIFKCLSVPVLESSKSFTKKQQQHKCGWGMG